MTPDCATSSRRATSLFPVLFLALAVSGCGGGSEGPMSTPPPESGPPGRIVFTFLPTSDFSESEIGLIDPDGTDRVQLTNDGAANGNAALSPDGTRIAYSKDGVIHIMSSDGSGDQPLQPGNFPEFAPNGQRIVYVANGEIRAMDLDGSDVETLRAGGDMPDWSSDGRIAFRDSRSIWVMDADGSDPRELVADTPTDSYASPRWSPDATRIAFESCGPEFCHIEVVDSDGSNREALTTGPVLDFLPDWSPDGEWIVFERDAGTSFNLWLMRADGSSSTAITTSGDASTPKWGS